MAKQKHKNEQITTIYDTNIEQTVSAAIAFLDKTEKQCAIASIEEIRTALENSIRELFLSLMKDIPVIDGERRIKIGKTCEAKWLDSGALYIGADAENYYFDKYVIGLQAPEFEQTVTQDANHITQLQLDWAKTNIEYICQKIETYISQFSPKDGATAVADYLRDYFSSETTAPAHNIYKLELIKTKAKKLLDTVAAFDSHYERFDEFTDKLEHLFSDNFDPIRKDGRTLLMQLLDDDKKHTIGQPHKRKNTDKSEFAYSFRNISDKDRTFNINVFTSLLSKYPDILSYKIRNPYNTYTVIDVTTPFDQLLRQFKSLITSYMSAIHGFARPLNLFDLYDKDTFYYGSWQDLMSPEKYGSETAMKPLLSKNDNMVVILPTDELVQNIAKLISSNKKELIYQELDSMSYCILQQFTVPFVTNAEIYENVAANPAAKETKDKIITHFTSAIGYHIYDDFETSINRTYTDLINTERDTLWETGKSASDTQLQETLQHCLHDKTMFHFLPEKDHPDILTLKNIISKNVPLFIERIEQLQNILLTSTSQNFIEWLLTQKAISKKQYQQRISELEAENT